MNKTIRAAIIVVICIATSGFVSAKEQENISIMPPTDIRLEIVPTGFLISWKPAPQNPESVTAYEILRASVASGPFIKVALVERQATQFVDISANPEIIYYYKIRAVAGGMFSPDSRIVAGER